jgi:ribonuclease BN (tRNA processing enzyme)
VAHQAGVKELVLFHHDPAHDDEKIDAMLIDAQKKAESLNIEKVSAAWESRVISFPLEAPDSIIKEATALSAN